MHGSSTTERQDGVTDDVPPPVLFLKSLEIENFRAIRKLSVGFQPGLNVIIGENNSAKTAIMDALRIVFALGSFERKEDFIRVHPTDLHVADEPLPTPTRDIDLAATFAAPSGTKFDGQFYELLSPEDSSRGQSVFKLGYSVKFAYNAAKGKYVHSGASVRGGPNLENPVTTEVLDSIRAIYLAPLRDLLNDRSRVGAEIERLIVSHTPRSKEADLRAIPGKVRDFTLDLVRQATENKHHDATSENFASYAKPYNIEKGSIAFTPWGISEGLLSTMLPVFQHLLRGTESDRLPLSSNGLGLNQLIYASVVLSRHGGAASDSDAVRFFVIEEPEAHLHPQLQDSFFHTLNEMRQHQVFVTSHSPSITAKADLDRLVIMRRSTPSEGVVSYELNSAFFGKDADKRYLHKFLDVTRSQLLFARGAIFVEGVTEGMLLQQFSEILGKSLRGSAIEIVVIDVSSRCSARIAHSRGRSC